MNTRGNDEGETHLDEFTAGGDSTAEMLELAIACSGQETMIALCHHKHQQQRFTIRVLPSALESSRCFIQPVG